MSSPKFTKTAYQATNVSTTALAATPGGRSYLSIHNADTQLVRYTIEGSAATMTTGTTPLYPGETDIWDEAVPADTIKVIVAAGTADLVIRSADSV